MKAWQLMGNTLDAALLPLAAELAGVLDIESLLLHLHLLRDHLRRHG